MQIALSGIGGDWRQLWRTVGKTRILQSNPRMTLLGHSMTRLAELFQSVLRFRLLKSHWSFRIKVFLCRGYHKYVFSHLIVRDIKVEWQCRHRGKYPDDQWIRIWVTISEWTSWNYKLSQCIAMDKVPEGMKHGPLQKVSSKWPVSIKMILSRERSMFIGYLKRSFWELFNTNGWAWR